MIECHVWYTTGRMILKNSSTIRWGAIIPSNLTTSYLIIVTASFTNLDMEVVQQFGWLEIA